MLLCHGNQLLLAILQQVLTKQWPRGPLKVCRSILRVIDQLLSLELLLARRQFRIDLCLVTLTLFGPLCLKPSQVLGPDPVILGLPRFPLAGFLCLALFPLRSQSGIGPVDRLLCLPVAHFSFLPVAPASVFTISGAVRLGLVCQPLSRRHPVKNRLVTFARLLKPMAAAMRMSQWVVMPAHVFAPSQP